ncbi:MAG: hypothetical protein IRY92_00640 [Dactylosporangium sp.]|nr:hypothetical protein [Dactylosporangium sp.]
MASGLVGANPDQLDELAARMNSGADTLEAIRHAIYLSLSRTEWPGPDGDQFRHDWDYRHTRLIAAAVTALREAARVARANADQQRAASGADSGRGGSRGPITLVPRGGGVGIPDISDLVTGAQNLLYIVDVLENLDDIMVPVSRIFDVADRFLPGPLDFLSVGMSLGDMLAEASRGELSLWTVGNFVWDVASLHPVGGLVTGAWEVGSSIGEWMANELDERFGITQGVIDHVVQERYGGDLTPSESADLVKRYEGPMGYVNITRDLISTGWNKLTGLFR